MLHFQHICLLAGILYSSLLLGVTPTTTASHTLSHIWGHHAFKGIDQPIGG